MDGFIGFLLIVGLAFWGHHKLKLWKEKIKVYSLPSERCYEDYAHGMTMANEHFKIFKPEYEQEIATKLTLLYEDNTPAQSRMIIRTDGEPVSEEDKKELGLRKNYEISTLFMRYLTGRANKENIDTALKALMYADNYAYKHWNHRSMKRHFFEFPRFEATIICSDKACSKVKERAKRNITRISDLPLLPYSIKRCHNCNCTLKGRPVRKKR